MIAVRGRQRGVAASRATVPLLSVSALASPKSSTLTVPSGVTLMLAGLVIAVHDPFLVCRLESVRDLPASAVAASSGSGPRATRSANVALDEFEHQSRHAVHVLQRVNRGDMRNDSAPRAGELRARSVPDARIRADECRQNLDGDIAM